MPYIISSIVAIDNIYLGSNYIINVMSREKITMRVAVSSMNGEPVIKTFSINEKVSGFVIDLQGYEIKDIVYQVLDYVYESHHSFREGFAGVCRGRRWGFINLGLHEVVKPEYESVNLVSEGFAAVMKEGKYGYIKVAGSAYPSVWTDFKYDSASDFNNGRARVKKGELYGFIGNDYKSKELIPCRFEYAYDFDHTYPFAVVKENGKYGMIDKSGNWKIEPIFDEYYISSKHNGTSYYNVTIGEKQYYLHCDGHYEEVKQ